MAWATDAEILDALAVELKRAAADLPATVTAVVARRSVTAQGEIRRRLAGRGYTDAQMAAATWVELVDIHRDQALSWCVVDLRHLFKDDEGELTKRLNRLAELDGHLGIEPAGTPTASGPGVTGVLNDRQAFDQCYPRWPPCPY